MIVASRVWVLCITYGRMAHTQCHWKGPGGSQGVWPIGLDCPSRLGTSFGLLACVFDGSMWGSHTRDQVPAGFDGGPRARTGRTCKQSLGLSRAGHPFFSSHLGHARAHCHKMQLHDSSSSQNPFFPFLRCGMATTNYLVYPCVGLVLREAIGFPLWTGRAPSDFGWCS